MIDGATQKISISIDQGKLYVQDDTSFTIEVCLHLSYFICFLCYRIIVKVTFASLRKFYEIS